MTTNLTPLQCPSCGGLLRTQNAQLWQCVYCESRYMLLGEEAPVPGLTRVVDERDPEHSKGFYFYEDEDTHPYTGMIISGETSQLKVAQIKARWALNDFGGRFPIPRPKERPRQPLLR